MFWRTVIFRWAIHVTSARLACGRQVNDGPEGGVNDGAGTERRGHGRREHNTQIALYTLL